MKTVSLRWIMVLVGIGMLASVIAFSQDSMEFPAGEGVGSSGIIPSCLLAIVLGLLVKRLESRQQR